MGFAVGGPSGGLLGDFVGAVALEVLKPATERFGVGSSAGSFVNARRLLTLAAHAEADAGAALTGRARYRASTPDHLDITLQGITGGRKRNGVPAGIRITLPEGWMRASLKGRS